MLCSLTHFPDIIHLWQKKTTNQQKKYPVIFMPNHYQITTAVVRRSYLVVHCSLLEEDFGQDGYPWVQEEHCCHISPRNVLHCAILESAGAVVEASFRCSEVERHSLELEYIDARVGDDHKYLDAECLQMVVVPGVDTEAVVNLEERRKEVVEK
jgi:hypothetical protein